jgi:hypothetical protein
MHRLLALLFAILVLVSVRPDPVSARATSTDDVTVAQTATPAVVNIALWKMRPPTKAGDPPRRVKTYRDKSTDEPMIDPIQPTNDSFPPTAVAA